VLAGLKVGEVLGVVIHATEHVELDGEWRVGQGAGEG
jgi:hypothetical protein